MFEFVRHIILAYLLYVKLFPLLKCLRSIHLKDAVSHINLLLQKTSENYTTSSRIHGNTLALEIPSDNLIGSYLPERNHIFREVYFANSYSSSGISI